MGKKIRNGTVSLKKLKVLPEKYVVKTEENYKGFSYGDIIVRWLRWLMSDNPDKHQYRDILFLRGSIGYHESASNYLEASIDLTEGLAILVPIVTTHYTLGEKYNGITIHNEFSLREALREHVDAAGPFWATLTNMGKRQEAVKLVTNLELFRVESMPFELNISEENPFLNKMDEPNIPGKHLALVGGYFVILRDLRPSLYLIRFGGYGMDRFYTESLYKINIKARKVTNKDISGPKFAANRLQFEKKVPIKTNILLF